MAASRRSLFHQDDVRRFDGHIGARADGQAHVGPGQGGGVVDAVAHHGHPLALFLQRGHMALFFLRQNFGDNCGDAQAPADGFGSAPVVAGEHDDIHTQLPESGNGGGTAGFGGICNGDQTQQTAIRSKKQRRLSLCGQSFCLGGEWM